MNDEVAVLKGSGKSSQDQGSKDNKQNPIYRHLMNGVSYMIPFIVIGGLLIAVALTLGGEKQLVV